MVDEAQAAPRPELGAAVVTAFLSGLTLGWLPILGPFIAGYVAGRKARRPLYALGASIVPAALWVVGLTIASRHEYHLGGQYILVGPLAYLAPVTGAALVGGALMGTRVRPARVAGALILIVALAWLYPRAKEVWKLGADIWAASHQQAEADRGTGCPENLTQLYNAARFYSDDWDGHLPPGDRWITALKDKVPKDEQLHCPAVSRGGGNKYGYAMNPNMGGKKLEDAPDRAKTPLFYDSSELGPNAHGGMDTLPLPGRHAGKNNIVYADGHLGQL